MLQTNDASNTESRRRSVLLDGEMLRRLYRSKGMTRERLAKAAGLTVRTVGNALAGRPVDEETAARLAKAVGLDRNEAGPGELLQSGDPPPAASHALPRAPRLVGRDAEVAAVRNALAGSGGAACVCITGPAGVGKTAVALHCAQALISAGPFAAAAWCCVRRTALTLHGVARRAGVKGLSDLLSAIADALGITVAGRGVPRDAILSALAARPTLLLVDGADDLPGDAARLLAWLAEELPPPSRMLLTSRWPAGTAGCHSIAIGALARVDALRLLGQAAADKGLPLAGNDKESLIDALGGVPMLLAWAVGRMALTGRRAAAILHAMQEPGGDVYEWSFGEAWRALSWPGARRVVMAAALCPQPASRDFLGIAAGLPESEDRDAAIGEAAHRAALLQHDPAAGRFSLLPLTRAFALAALAGTPQEPALRARAADYYAGLAEREKGSPALLDLERQNILALADWCLRAGDRTRLARLAAPIAAYLREREPERLAGYMSALGE